MQDKRNIENVIQEIMGLVVDYAKCYHSRRTCKGALFDDVEKKSDAIESKLREMVEQTTVQKPLSDEQMETLIEKHAPPIHPDFSEDDDFDELIRAVERAHGITEGI